MGIFMDQFRQAEISPINKRSIEIDGHRTSVSLEDAFWVELKKIAAIHDVRTAELIATINREQSTPIFLSYPRIRAPSLSQAGER